MGPGSRSPQLRKGARLAGMTISERRQGCVNPAGASPGTTALARLHRRHMPGEGRVLHQLAAALEAGERVGPEIVDGIAVGVLDEAPERPQQIADRKSTRLNSSH